MQKITFAAAIAAALALSACNTEPEVLTVERDDPMAEALRNAAPVELPPAIQASRTYRCRDNSLVYIDFYTNDTAHVRTERTGMPTILTAEGGNPPFTAEGYSVSANAEEIQLTMPGKGSQSCRTG